MPSDDALSDEEAFNRLCRVADPVEQRDLLDDLCGDDHQRRNHLVSLLEIREDADRFFAVLDSSKPKRSRSTVNETPTVPENAADTPVDSQFSRSPLKQIGNYELTRLVGRGGMGNVFHARDPVLDREVALKVPRVELMLSRGVERRFIREARAAARLDHPHLVSILQVGSDGLYPYIASQWCDGGDLATWMREHPQPRDPRDVAMFMAAVADAIQHCHDRRIVHLDLKPSNILLVGRDEQTTTEGIARFYPKVTDFGLARLIDVQLDKTTDSMFLGTPLYMAPEQAECQRSLIGPASDVFAMGVVLHELATGERPFDGETLTVVLDRIRAVNPNSTMALRKLPRDLRTIISRCLQREPTDRYKSAQSLRDDLKRFASENPIRIRRVSIGRRFWLWCRRPERIKQAGVITVAIQVAVLSNLYSHYVLLGLGYRVPFDFDNRQFFIESIPVALFPHLPLLINGVRTIRHRRWCICIGTLLSLAFAVLLASVLLGGRAAFSAYKGNPFASYVAHLFIGCMAMVQLCVHLIAIPAAAKMLADRKRNAPSKTMPELPTVDDKTKAS
ncbi:serine/threonine-protein kinase [Crateriforma spongiae]|uniref:serine/threonine-protein kinase n=1 Tax=Crateriforma spongiae TaxID=2724528 RepID=UPI0014463686|nr:serine/threonine-protein kinase [Crateriforma spongiae]